MPRPNTRRTIASEANLAERITHEREQREMSYAGLAQRMTELGCAIDQSAIYKIEKAKPRRRITVDELVALAEVFGITVQNLLLPPGLLDQERAVELFEETQRAWEELDRVLTDVIESTQEYLQHMDDHPAVDRWFKDEHPERVKALKQRTKVAERLREM
jgi:transcriptional regulator with XRE-family HTH domain